MSGSSVPSSPIRLLTDSELESLSEVLSNDAFGFPNVDNRSVGTADFLLAGGGVGGIKEAVEDFDDFLVTGDGVRGGGVKEGGGD